MPLRQFRKNCHQKRDGVLSLGKIEGVTITILTIIIIGMSTVIRIPLERSLHSLIGGDNAGGGLKLLWLKNINQIEKGKRRNYEKL